MFLNRTGEGFTPNDIALLHLETPAPELVEPLAIATEASGDFANEACTIVGWGLQRGTYLCIPRKVEIRV